MRYPWNILFCQFVISDTPGLYPHYIYPHYPHIKRSTFQIKNPSHYPWEWEIVIPTILYTIHCGFPQLLLLHFQIFKRLIAQTLTTPILSGKWGFGVTRKHWKKPFVLVDAIELNCIIRRFREDKASLSQLVAGAWRARVHGVNLAWRVFGWIDLLFEGRGRGFSPSSSVSSSITH